MREENQLLSRSKATPSKVRKYRLFGKLLIFTGFVFIALFSMVSDDDNLDIQERHLLTGRFLVYVRQSDDSQVAVEMSADGTVSDVINELKAQNAWQQGMALCFANEILKPNEPLADSGIGAEAMLHITFLYRPLLDLVAEDFERGTIWNFKASDRSDAFFQSNGAMYTVRSKKMYDDHNGRVWFTNKESECLMRLEYNTETGSIYGHIYLRRGENGLYAAKQMPMLEDIEITETTPAKSVMKKKRKCAIM